MGEKPTRNIILLQLIGSTTEQKKGEMTMFHCKDGWYFERLISNTVPDQLYAGVRIIKRESARENAPIVAQIKMTASEWASIVATVSALSAYGEIGTIVRMFEAAQKG